MTTTTEQQCPDYWTSESTGEIFKALHEFHSKPPQIVKEGIISMHGKDRKYITLDSILHAVRPALAELGVFIMQHLAGDSLITIIQHKSGEFVASALTFQTMNGSGTNNLQNLGGGLTYLRRYALTAILGIAADEDNDGSDGGIEKKSTASTQLPEPTKWLNKLKKDGSFTEEWSNLIRGIEIGTVTSVAEVAKYYKLSKETRSEIEALLK